MLGFNPAQGFLHNEDDPLPVDMVIVDESSMLDEVLAYSLFRAVDPRSHLLLVGDVDQLPSVGAGDVLRDLIASAAVRGDTPRRDFPPGTGQRHHPQRPSGQSGAYARLPGKCLGFLPIQCGG